MHTLSLALTIAISAHALIGMEIEQQLINQPDCMFLTSKKNKLSPITLAQTYYYFIDTELLVPDIIKQIFLLQIKLSNVNLKTLSNEIKKNCKYSMSLVTYINTLIDSCDSPLASELCQQLFPYDTISICDIKENTDEGISFGGTSLHCAVEKEYPAVIQILLKIAGDKAHTLLTVKDMLNRTALDLAITNKHTESIQLLLNAAGDNAWTQISMQNKDGKTALHRATVNDNPQNIQLLLNAAGNKAQTLLFMQNSGGWTALHIVALYGHTESIQLILDAAGDQAQTLLSIKNNHGWTAFDIANLESQKVMLKYMTH